MKHEVTTLNTKKMLASSLKNHMKKKPLSKITVSEIIADCGVNRKTFYYHFETIYALLKWMLEQEAVDVVKQFDLMTDYKEAILFVMDYVDNNKHILNCAFDTMGREELKRFFYHDFTGMIHTLIDDVEQNLSLTVDPEFKNFLTNLYSDSLASLLIDWIQDKNQYGREKTLDYISLLFHASMPAVLRAGADR